MLKLVSLNNHIDNFIKIIYKFIELKEEILYETVEINRGLFNDIFRG